MKHRNDMLANLASKAWLIYLGGVLSLLLIGVGGVGIGSLGSTEAGLKAVYQDRMVALEQLQQVAALIDANQLRVIETVTAQSEDTVLATERSEAVKRDAARIDALWKSYLGKTKTAEEERLAEAFAALRERYERQGLFPVLAALGVRDFGQATALLQGPMGDAYHAVQESVDALIALQREVGTAELEAGAVRNARVRHLAVAALLLGVVLAAATGMWLARAVVRPLRDMAVAVNPDAPSDAGAQEETSRQLAAMQERLTDTLARIREVSGVIGRVSHEIAAGNPAAIGGEGNQAPAEGPQVQVGGLAEAARSVKPGRAGVGSAKMARGFGANVVPLRPRTEFADRQAKKSGGDNE